MPELPEVETIARGLAKRITGEMIESVWLGQKKEPLKSPAEAIAAALEHSRIVSIRRMGKHIIFDLARDGVARITASAKGRRHRPTTAAALRKEAVGGARPTATGQWIVHLGMTGRLQVCDSPTEIAKHTHAILRLASGSELRFVDPRRFGRLSVVTAENFEASGIEPLEADAEQFLQLFSGRKTPVKSALLNQKLLRGVGNIYADESLFRAGIRPRRRVSTISREQLTRLLSCVQEVLKEAIALGGSSISDYVDADGEEGFFQLQHRVYARGGEPCFACKTPIKRVIVAGRSSHYCPKCQK